MTNQMTTPDRALPGADVRADSLFFVVRSSPVSR